MSTNKCACAWKRKRRRGHSLDTSAQNGLRSLCPGCLHVRCALFGWSGIVWVCACVFPARCGLLTTLLRETGEFCFFSPIRAKGTDDLRQVYFMEEKGCISYSGDTDWRFTREYFQKIKTFVRWTRTALFGFFLGTTFLLIIIIGSLYFEGRNSVVVKRGGRGGGIRE